MGFYASAISLPTARGYVDHSTCANRFRDNGQFSVEKRTHIFPIPHLLNPKFEIVPLAIKCAKNLSTQN